MKLFFLVLTINLIFIGNTQADVSKAFDVESVDEVFKILNISNLKESDTICFNGPKGSGTPESDLTPIKAYSNHIDISDMYLIIEENKYPLAAHYSFTENMSDSDKVIDFFLKLPKGHDSTMKVIVKAGKKHFVSISKLFRAENEEAIGYSGESVYKGKLDEFVMPNNRVMASNRLTGTKLGLLINHPSAKNLYLKKINMKINDTPYYSAEFNRNVLTSNTRIMNLLLNVPEKGDIVKFTLENNLNIRSTTSKKISGISKNKLEESIISTLDQLCENGCKWEELFSKVSSSTFFNSEKLTKKVLASKKYNAIKIRYPAAKNDGWEWREKLLIDLIKEYPEIRTNNTLISECSFK